MSETFSDIKQILQLLPHRYPFVLVDRVLCHTPEKRIVALKNVTINEPFFQGHFPVEPVMPGVLILEGMAQAGAILVYLSDQEAKGKTIFFAGIDEVRFRQKVVPGDQLKFDLTVANHRRNFWKVNAFATVEGKKVAEAKLTAAVQ